MPRIFISYRRSDSIAITGRIYDRLIEAFSEEQVFKDVEDIPVGVNFKTILENEIDACDVLLVIIGPTWATVTDEHETRRLDDPDDFVRVEVVSGLKRADKMVIPVLVDDARMPDTDGLPSDLRELALRNAAVVRNDPDFNQDIQKLIKVLQDHFGVTGPVPRPQTAPRRTPWRWIVAALGVAVVLCLLIDALLSSDAIIPFLTEIAPTQSAPAVARVEPVAPGEYMVLVAQVEHLGGAERDVTRFIVEDLTRTLEEEVPFSQIRVREYPQIMTARAEALAAAETNGATVVIWGNYDAERIELAVQIGVTTAFPAIQMSRETLERLADVQARMTDERRESVAPQVLSILDVLLSADGNGYEVSRMIAIQDEIDVIGAETLGDSVAAHVHRFEAAYADDTAQAIAEIDAALEKVSDPLLYLLRGVARLRQGHLDDARRDARTALRLSADQWVTPLYTLSYEAFLRGDLEEAITLVQQVADRRPDDWFVLFMRGALRYYNGEYDLAKPDLEQAVAREPNANWPYAIASLIASREGRIADEQALMNTVAVRFPDPLFGNRVIEAMFGDENPNIFGPMLAGFAHQTLGQYDEVVQDIDRALAVDDQLADLYLMQGFAYCNLGDYEAAEAAYTHGIELEPDYIVLYLLRAEARIRQNTTAALASALADAAVVQQQGSAELQALIEPGMQGELTCENFFTYELPHPTPGPE